MFASLLFVFVSISRVLDLSLPRLHLPLVLALASLLAVILSGAIFNFFESRAAMIYIGITGLLILGVPFGLSRRVRLDFLTNTWLHTFLFIVVVISVFDTSKRVAYLMNAIAAAVLTVALLGLTRGIGDPDGRLIIEGAGKLNNPNDLAFVLLLGLPPWWRYMKSGKTGILRKCVGAGAIATILVCFMKTGSRGGMVALFALGLFALWRAPAIGKVTITIAAAALFLVAAVALPQHLRQRFFTFSAPDTEDLRGTDDQSAVRAVGSTEERKRILVESMKITLQHPFFGVGPELFADAENQFARSLGRRKGDWLGTHNTYTQFSSECGIPVLILFVWLLAMNLRSLQATLKRTRGDPRPRVIAIRNAALAAEALMWQGSVFIFFAHVAYNFETHLFIGVAIAVSMVARRELGALPGEALSVPGNAATPAFAMAGLRRG